MPVTCSENVLVGYDGSIAFTPAGTEFCLQDHIDFPAGTKITVPLDNEYRVGDVVTFTAEGTAKLDTALTAGTNYYVVARTATTISVSATAGGTPITLTGDGGLGSPTGGVPATITAPTLPTTSGAYGTGPYTGIATTGGKGVGLTVDVAVTGNNVTGITLGTVKGSGYEAGDIIKIAGTDLGGTSPANDLVFTIATASAITGGGDTPGAANHINVDFADFLAVCQVKGFSLSLTRESLDTTTLPCGTGAKNGKMAPFRTSQSGYATGEGSMQVQFTEDQSSLANRLLANSMLSNQNGAEVRLFVATRYDAGGKVDVNKSLYVEGPISIMGFSINVTPDETIVADLQFMFSGQPTKILGF